jgi:hypothetical protein
MVYNDTAPPSAYLETEMKQILLFTLFVLLAGSVLAAPHRYTAAQADAARLAADQRHLAAGEKCRASRAPVGCHDIADSLWRKDQARIHARRVGTPHARAEATRVIREQDARMRAAKLIP